MDKKKICLLIPSLNAGGMERVMSELANYFVGQEQMEIHLVLYGINPAIFYPLNHNIKVYQPKAKFNDTLRSLSTMKRLFYLRKTVRHIQPDTALSFGEYWNNFALIGLLGLKIPIYVSDRCQPDKSLGRIHDKLRKWLYPKAAGVVVQTEKALEIYRLILLTGKIHVIGNPIRIIHQSKVIAKEKIILMVSRLISTKHHDRLISIFSKLDAPDWKLVIVGGEALKQKHVKNLKELANQLGIANKVIFEGEQKNVEDYYLRSSIFAFTSSSEGFPNVIGEALSSGLSVVSYDCIAGPSDMIDDGKNGFLIPLFDDEKFRQKLQLLIDDEVLRSEFGNAAKRRIQKFSVESIGKQYLKLITQ